MPITAIAAGLAAFSMAGAPPFFGFIGKESLYEATLHAPTASTWLSLVAFLASVAFVVVGAMIAYRPFFGARKETPKQPHEAPWTMWIGPVVLSIMGLIFGLLPAPIGHALVGPAASSVMGEAVEIHLGLWHGVTTALGLSILTLLSGAALYAGLRLYLRLTSRAEPMMHWGPSRWYEIVLESVLAFGRLQTRVIQNGYLRVYILVTVSVTAMLTWPVLLSSGAIRFPGDWTEIGVHESGLALILVLGVIGTLVSRSRLGAIAALGIVGYGVGLLYVMFRAPDLAMTQFIVETLNVLLFMLAFYHLPSYEFISKTSTRLRDALIAISVGSLMTCLVLAATSTDFHPSISNYFIEHSEIDAHGRNIVNVILVDFRGFDTMGEITVLAVAGVGAYALIKLREGAREN